MVRAVTISLILIGLICNTAHNSLVTYLLASFVKDCHADFSLLIGSLQMCILLVGAANTTQGHPVSNFFQQSVLSKFLPQNIRVLL